MTNSGYTMSMVFGSSLALQKWLEKSPKTRNVAKPGIRTDQECPKTRDLLGDSFGDSSAEWPQSHADSVLLRTSRGISIGRQKGRKMGTPAREDNEGKRGFRAGPAHPQVRSALALACSWASSRRSQAPHAFLLSGSEEVQ